MKIARAFVTSAFLLVPAIAAAQPAQEHREHQAAAGEQRGQPPAQGTGAANQHNTHQQGTPHRSECQCCCCRMMQGHGGDAQGQRQDHQQHQQRENPQPN